MLSSLCCSNRIVVHGEKFTRAIVPFSAKPFNFQTEYRLTEEQVIDCVRLCVNKSHKASKNIINIILSVTILQKLKICSHYVTFSLISLLTRKQTGHINPCFWHVQIHSFVKYFLLPCFRINHSTYSYYYYHLYHWFTKGII